MSTVAFLASVVDPRVAAAAAKAAMEEFAAIRVNYLLLVLLNYIDICKFKINCFRMKCLQL